MGVEDNSYPEKSPLVIGDAASPEVPEEYKERTNEKEGGTYTINPQQFLVPQPDKLEKITRTLQGVIPYLVMIARISRFPFTVGTVSEYLHSMDLNPVKIIDVYHDRSPYDIAEVPDDPSRIRSIIDSPIKYVVPAFMFVTIMDDLIETGVQSIASANIELPTYLGNTFDKVFGKEIDLQGNEFYHLGAGDKNYALYVDSETGEIDVYDYEIINNNVSADVFTVEGKERAVTYISTTLEKLGLIGKPNPEIDILLLSTDADITARLFFETPEKILQIAGDGRVKIYVKSDFLVYKELQSVGLPVMYSSDIDGTTSLFITGSSFEADTIIKTEEGLSIQKGFNPELSGVTFLELGGMVLANDQRVPSDQDARG